MISTQKLPQILKEKTSWHAHAHNCDFLRFKEVLSNGKEKALLNSPLKHLL